MAEWKPIESAPVDGTRILLARAGEWVCEGSYQEDGYGWFAANNDPTDHWGGPIDPTHWMPMPEPPAP